MKVLRNLIITLICLLSIVALVACSKTPAGPTEYEVVFKAGETIVATEHYTTENKDITEPAVPNKEHYTGEWEAYELTEGDITVNAVYTPKTYTISWYNDTTKVGESKTWTYGETAVSAPTVPDKEHYTGVWSEYTYDESDDTINVTAIYMPKTYTIKWYIDGEEVDTKTWTYDEEESADAPAIPNKEHYTSAWGEYLYDENADIITVDAVYTPKTYTISWYNGATKVGESETWTYGEAAVSAPAVPDKEGYSGTWGEYEYNEEENTITVQAEYEILKFTVIYQNEEGNPLYYETVEWDTRAPSKPIDEVQGKFAAWTLDDKVYDFTAGVRNEITLKIKRYDITVEVASGGNVAATFDTQYTFNEDCAVQLTPSAWHTTFRLVDANLEEADWYAVDIILKAKNADQNLSIYFLPDGKWDNRLNGLRHDFTVTSNEKVTLYLNK